MKKPSSDIRQAQILLTRKRERKNLLRKYGRAWRKETRAPEQKRFKTRKIHSFSFGENIDIYQANNRKKLSEICERIRAFKGNNLILSFVSDKLKISAAGMLLLYAEIYRKMEIDNTKITCNYPNNRKAEQVLQHIGFFRKIGKEERISNDEIRNADKDVHSWHVIIASKFNGEEVYKFLDKVFPPGRGSDVYSVVSEIIGNVIYHAYEKDADFCPWIAFARINEENEISVVVGDLGKTIPHTIQKHSWYKEWKSRKSLTDLPERKKRRSDSQLIHIATKLGQSVTLESNRGKGLMHAIEHINGMEGKVLIYSRAGYYYSRSSSSRKEQRKEDKQATTVNGTIVQITIPLSPIGK